MQKKNKGFSLIELVMAATIFSFLVTGIFCALFSGIKIWNRVGNTDFKEMERLLGLESLARELRQGLFVEAIGFEGSGKEFSFASRKGNSIIKLNYKFDPDNKVIVRGVTDLKDIVKNNVKEALALRPIFALDDLAVEYYYYDHEKETYAWKKEWKKEDGIFNALRLHITINNEKTDRTIFIPFA